MEKSFFFDLKQFGEYLVVLFGSQFQWMFYFDSTKRTLEKHLYSAEVHRKYIILYKYVYTNVHINGVYFCCLCDKTGSIALHVHSQPLMALWLSAFLSSQNPLHLSSVKQGL